MNSTPPTDDAPAVDRIEEVATPRRRPPAVQVHDLVGGFAGTPVLEHVTLNVEAGTTAAVLGPSGCGKTTLLRLIAGFLQPMAGSISLLGQVVASRAPGTALPQVWTPPENRRVGYVAQEGALFPHLTVAANIAFGLPRRQRGRRAANDTVNQMLDLVRLDRRLTDRYPHELSGGQQQRVALARALVRRPRVVLLDEPFSALDAGLRNTTRTAVRAALDAAGVTVILVTHDQDEALSFADQVALVRDGRIIQVDEPRAAYQHPVDKVAADFLGEAVHLPGTSDGTRVSCGLGVLDARVGSVRGVVDVVIRPEQIDLAPLPEGPTRGRNEPDTRTPGVVEQVTYFGHDALVEVRLLTGELVSSRIAPHALPSPGDTVHVTVRGTVLTYKTNEGPPG